MESVKVSSEGRITIPIGLRKKLGVKPGTKVVFEGRGNEIIAHPLTPIHNKICKCKIY